MASDRVNPAPLDDYLRVVDAAEGHRLVPIYLLQPHH